MTPPESLLNMGNMRNFLIFAKLLKIVIFGFARIYTDIAPNVSPMFPRG